jgi:hypothetical protein
MDDRTWIKVAVPEGQGGRLWKFEDCDGVRQLATVPPYLARTAKDLLLPREVVDADKRQQVPVSLPDARIGQLLWRRK